MLEFIITSSVLILIITAVRFVFKGKISLRLQYALWLIVAIRLLVPVQPVESSLSVLNFIPTPYNEVRSEMIEVDVPKALLDEIDIKNTFYGKHSMFGTYNRDGQKIEYPPVGISNIERGLFIIWLAGTAVSFAVFITSNIYFSILLRKNRRLLDTNNKIKFYMSSKIPSPCLYGLIKPSVYVASDHTEKEYRYIVAHELCHYYHKDHLWSLMRMVCVCIHWYNPFVWMAAALSKRDGELACDESTIKMLGEEERIEYGRTLINLTSQKSSSFSILSGATTMVAGKHCLKERISLIAKKPNIFAAASAFIILIIMIASVCTFTGKKFDEAEGKIYTIEERPGGTIFVRDENGNTRVYGGYTKEQIISFYGEDAIINEVTIS